MNRSKYFDFIEEKLSFLATRIEVRGKLNILDLHLHSENFYLHFFNLLFGWELENLNAADQNAAGIDLVDKTKRIVVQVSATATREKVESALAKDLSDYKGYSFKFISICKDAKNLRTKIFLNPHGLTFMPGKDIFDVGSILKIISVMDIDRLKQIYEFVKKEIKGDSGLGSGVIHNLPYESLGSIFKGRAQALGRLGEVLASGKRAAITQVGTICGLGGIGKTRLAVEFAWEGLREERFGQAYFVRCGMDDKAQGLFGEKSDDEVTDKEAATAQGRFTAAIAELAGAGVMGLGMEGKTQREMAQAVLGQLQQGDGWLVILDNVDDRAMQECVRQLLPQLVNGKVIVTSRLAEWREEETESIEINKLSQPDSIAYLLERTEKRRAKSDDDSALAKQVAKEMDGLPIALEQAAAHINRRRVGLAEYIEEFEKHREEVLGADEGRLRVDYPKPVLTTWQATEEQLSEIAKELIGLMSFLGPEAIPAELFTKIDESLETEGKETLGVHEGLVELADWSMITYEDGQVTVHRLIQEVTRLRMDEDVYRKLCETAAKMVNDYMPVDPPADDVRSWGYWEVMAGHAEMVAGYADEQGIAEPTSLLMNQLGQFLYAQARYAEAEPMFRRSIEIFEKSYDKEHPGVATALNDLALLLKITNRLAEAEPMYRRVIELYEKSYGKEHPYVATALNNLAQLLRDTNRLAEAEPLMRRVVEIFEKIYGRKHPQVAVALNNLSLLFGATNRLDEAEPLMRRVVGIFEKTYGRKHPQIAVALNNLAQLLQDTNRLDEAEPMYRRALDIHETSFGSDHPALAYDLNNLALLLRATNRVDEAEAMMRRALTICEKSLGADHPTTVTARGNLEGLKN